MERGKKLSEKSNWVTDELVDDCYCCLSKFNFSHRRHHCRQCGRIICNSCSHSRLTLPAYHNDVRVCDICYTSITAKRRGVNLRRLNYFVESHKNNLVSQDYIIEATKLTKEMDSIYQKIQNQHNIFSGSLGKGEDVRTYESSMSGLFEAHAKIRHALTDLYLSQGKMIKVALLPKSVVNEVAKHKRRKDTATEKERSAYDTTIKTLPYRYFIITGEPNVKFGLTEIINRPKPKRKPAYRSLTGYKMKKKKQSDFQFLVENLRKDDGDGQKDDSSVQPNRKIKRLMKDRKQDKLIKGIEGFGETKEIADEYPGIRYHWIRTVEQISTAKGWKARTGDGNNYYFGLELQWDKQFCWIEERDKEYNKKNVSDDPKTSKKDMRPAALLLLDKNINLTKLQNEVLELINAHRKKYFERVKKQKPIVERLFKAKTTKVEWENPKHCELLEQVWQGFHSLEQLKEVTKDGHTSEFPGHNSEMWKEIGFQGRDPMTDFRGMGLLSVEVIIYLGMQYPKLAQRLAKVERAYPLCTAVINIVHCVADFLGITKATGPKQLLKKSPLFALFCISQDKHYYQQRLHTYLQEMDNNEDHKNKNGRNIQKRYFEELTVAILVLLDRRYVEEQAGYMDFPHIMKKIKEKVQNILNSQPVNFNAFVELLLADDIPKPPTPHRRPHTLISASPAGSPVSITPRSLSPLLSDRRLQSYQEMVGSIVIGSSEDEVEGRFSPDEDDVKHVFSSEAALLLLPSGTRKRSMNQIAGPDGQNVPLMPEGPER